MICVAANSVDSLENVQLWQNEIVEKEPEKPIMLILTKSDLIDYVDDAVTYQQIKTAKDEHGLQGCSQTSSKVWEDFNVHKAFNKTLITAFKSKNMQ